MNSENVSMPKGTVCSAKCKQRGSSDHEKKKAQKTDLKLPLLLH